MAPQLLLSECMRMSQAPRLANRLLGGLVAGLSVYVLVACSPNNGAAPSSAMQVPGVRYQSDAEVSPAQVMLGAGNPSVNVQVANASGSHPQGTGDLGGGDGLDGKLFEAYIVDIVRDVDYQTYLQPIDEHMLNMSVDDPKTEEREGISPMAFAAFMKHWYIAPVQLNKVDKQSLGINFIMDPVQQMALQNRREVWIDQNLLPKDPKERARLYLHELMMSFYMLQFEDFDKLCENMKAGAKCSGGSKESKENAPDGSDFSGIENLFKAIMAPKPRRVLDANDYANVRAVTDFLFTQSAQLKTFDDVKQLFINKGFDGRIFGEYNKPEFDNNEDFRAIRQGKMQQDRKESGQRLARAIREMSMSGHAPKFCRFNDTGDSEARCEMIVGKPNYLENGQTILPIKLIVKNLAGQTLQTVNTRIVIENELRLGQTSLASGFKNSNVYEYQAGHSMVEDENGVIQTEARDGDRIWGLEVYMVGEDFNVDMIGFEIRPYLVTDGKAYGNVNAKTPTFDKIRTELIVAQEKISGRPGINRQYPNGYTVSLENLGKQFEALCKVDKNCALAPDIK